MPQRGIKENKYGHQILICNPCSDFDIKIRNADEFGSDCRKCKNQS